MARIRSIHPGLYTDEAFMALSLAGKVAFPGIWTECDDQGVFEWKPLVLKARIFPVDAVDMAAVLDEMVASGCVQVIDVSGKRYGLVRNFRKWQRPEKPKCRFPLPDEHRLYVGLEPNDRQPVTDAMPTGSRMSPQREEEGGKMKDEGGEREGARAQGDLDVKVDPPHWQAVQSILEARSGDVDEWELDFLHSIKWKPSLTKPQAESLKAIQGKLLVSGPSPAVPKQVVVIEGTAAWAAWTKHRGKRPPTTDVRIPGKQIQRGWYFPSEYPPTAENEAA